MINNVRPQLSIVFKLWVLFILPCVSLAQEAIVSGVIKDRNTHLDIRSVNVYVKGSKIGTTSDFAGRFSLRIPEASQNITISFRHIGYIQREIPLSDLVAQDKIYLQPRVIPLQGVQIDEEGLARPEIYKDLPQTVSVIDASEFEIRGYIDAGDLLRIDHSVQVSEEISGKKTVAIRGGNADEVVVLFNGVKMNNTFDNTFDLSLIDLEDLERFEVIKGSNTALYGPEAFSGVINIVPRVEQDYTLRFQQRLGTYRSGNWGLHLYRQFNRLYGSYSIKRGGLSRSIVDSGGDLDNSSIHHTANLAYRVGNNGGGAGSGTLSAMWVYTSLDHDEQRDFVRTIDNSNNLLSLRYSGAIGGLRDLDLSFSYKNLEEDQLFLALRTVRDRDIKDRTYIFDLKKEIAVSDVDLLFGYNYQRSELDFLDRFQTQALEDIGLEEGGFTRSHHGAVGILKYHGRPDSEFLHKVDLDVSARYDRVSDHQSDAVLRLDIPGSTSSGPGLFDDRSWSETMAKAAIKFSGYQRDLSFNGYMNFGANTKFPTLFQLISVPSTSFADGREPSLSPEKIRSLEVGADLSREIREHKNIYGWRVAGSYFQNHYENKFVEISNPSFPVSEFENVDNARISGFEGVGSIFLFDKKVSVDVGIARYFIPEKTAFPFKSDTKRTVTFNVNHAGYAFQVLWFKEGAQTGRVRFSDGVLGEFSLASTTNMDAHISKTFEIGNLKLFGNFSGRNLFNDRDATLEGLALRDRRIYLTVGAQY